MNYKQMTTRELTLYVLENRQNKDALAELRKRPGKKIIIPPETSIDETNQILSQIIKNTK
jgi:D-lyxose ketol-isomerase